MFRAASRRLFSRALRADASASTSATQAGKVNLRFSTPNGVIADGEGVFMVNLPTAGGVLGIQANHAPVIAELKPGVVQLIREDANDTPASYFVSGGFAVVTEDNTTAIAAVDAYELADFDADQAAKNLAEAKEQLAAADSDADKAEAQIAIDVYEPLVAELAK